MLQGMGGENERIDDVGRVLRPWRIGRFSRNLYDLGEIMKKKHPGIVAIAKAVKQEWRRVDPKDVANFKNLKFDEPIGSIHCDCGTTHFIYPDMLKKWATKTKITTTKAPKKEKK